ncbi:MAG: cytochrome c biogenesis protein CcsA [Planctomycetota bacterium]
MPPATDVTAKPRVGRPAPGPVEHALMALASLRLTVVLFALLIFLVFVGTLAQVDHDIWYVVEENYFRVWIATVEWQTFVRLAEMFTKSEAALLAGGFWFPGGKLIGVAMFANLMAAHTVRFKVAARGKRLAWGLGVLAAGVAATIAVIVFGMDQSLKGQLSPAFCNGLWQAWRAALAGFSLWSVYASIQQKGRLRPAEWWLSAVGSLTLLVLSGWLYANPSVAPDDSGMRIVWELTKCGGAAALAFAGCWMVFKQRAGIVLLHAGIALLMVGELVTDLAAVEGRMTIPEGQTSSYAEDIRTSELAITLDEGDATRVTVIPQHLLERASRLDEPISHPNLPFDLRVRRFDENSRLADPIAGEPNLATDGAGLLRVAVPIRGESGVSMESGVNVPAAYIEPLEKDSGKSLGIWLMNLNIRPQEIEVGGETYGTALRFKRLHKDYSITLNDFSFDRYAGTNIPKNYESDIVLRDPSRGVERPVRIWMNNPLRYAGDTLYQSGFDPETEKATILQVVTNGGWMIPYLSCMYVGLGMLAHFAITLTRFARRRVEEAARLAKKEPAPVTDKANAAPGIAWRKPTLWVPTVVALLVAGYFAGKARPATDEPGDMAIQRFGALPVAEGGRIKPIDTLARTTLQALSARQEVIQVDAAGEETDRLPAIQWMLDSLSGRTGWKDHRVFRIENLDLIEVLDLEPRPGSFRYSYGEVMADPDKVGEQVDLAVAQRRKIDEAEKLGQKVEPLTVVQKQTLSLADKLSLFHQMVTAFGEPRLSGDETTVRQQLMTAQSRAMQLRQSGAVRAVPPPEPDGEWATLYEAGLVNLMNAATNRPLDEAAVAWSEALVAYAEDDSGDFADHVTDIEAAIRKHQHAVAASPEVKADLAPSERLDTGVVRFEHFFSGFSPFYYCAAMYLVAFVLTAAGWLGQGGTTGGATWPRVLSRSAMAIVLVTLLVHTFALVGRVYISGRPPVTNLYSSAVFIGWAAVLFGVAFEAIYRLGVGNAVASVLGFSTLVVAHYLSLDGDTFTVLQAVLDTQFWLATHVVTITLGYSTTFLAGFLGIAYLLADALPRYLGKASWLDKRAGDQITRMTYGTLCFALLFSFVGTVLGGLWADDSWGRFWGWDPKENGALIIVLWNALVRHARWGKMIGATGIAALAVGGNVVTTWSWFGVNELGVGLHAYGDSESNTAIILLGFVVSQLAVIALGLFAPRSRTA